MLFNTDNGAQINFNASIDTYLARFSGNLATLRQSTYLGTSQLDMLFGMAADDNDDGSVDILVGGLTGSTVFPCTRPGVTPNTCDAGSQSLRGGGSDGFITRLSADLRQFRQSTYIGGAALDQVMSLMAVRNPDGSTDIIVAGQTQSLDFPCVVLGGGCQNGAQSSTAGNEEGFVARFSDDLKAVSPQFIRTTDATRTFSPSGTVDVSSLAQARSGLPVSFSSNSADVCTVSGHTVTMLKVGECELAATQPGNSGWAVAPQQTLNITITQAPNLITFPVQTTGSRQLVQNGTFSISPVATASSGLPVTYNSASPTVCTVSGTTVTMVATGTCQLVASQAGDSNWGAATDETREVTIRAGANVITFPVQTPASRNFAVGATFEIGPLATASSGLPVTYSSDSPAVCTVSGVMVTMLSEGECLIVASQSGNAQWLAAVLVEHTVRLGGAAITPVPTVQAWALLLLALGLATVGAERLQRRRGR